MRKNLSLALFAVAAASSIVSAQPSLASRYEFVKLDYPGAPLSYPLGINSKREIVGVFFDATGASHGYLYKNGKFKQIDVPGSLATSTGGINDNGDMAGLYVGKDGFQHGFLRTQPEDCEDDEGAGCQPVYQTIDVPGALQTKGIPFETGSGLGTAAIGLNNRRDVVGLYATNGQYSAGFEYSQGEFKTMIDDPFSAHSFALGSRIFGINDRGIIAGAYFANPAPGVYVSHGFLYTGKEYIPVDVPNSEKGHFGTQVNGINDLGVVVGVYTDPAGAYHGLVWADKQFFTLDYPGGPGLSEVHGINGRGDVTGAYIFNPQPGAAAYRGFVAYRKTR